MYNTVFVLIIAVLIFAYVLERILDKLNLDHTLPVLPDEVAGVFDAEEYKRSQLYKRDNTRFSFVSSSLSFVGMLLLFFFGAFGWYDRLIEGLSSHYVVHVLIFFGSFALLGDLLNTPFDLYNTFVLEEKYGFNRTTVRTYILDKLKGWLIGAIVGGGLLALVTWIYMLTGKWFWLIALGLISLVSVFLNMFYSTLIVPLFNKQIPLEEGSLKSKIEEFIIEAGFRVDHIFVIDGSKRSSKANAYFSGLGPRKRIVLYDTLVENLEEEEIVAVLAHEVGHYKKKHSAGGMVLGTLQTALMFYLFSLFVGVDSFAVALGGAEASFHLGLLAFGVLYSPISMLTGLGTNALSRRFEFQADQYVKENYVADRLISSLKKLSKNNLSNLAPHPAYVFFHYSHPPLIQRIRSLQK
ncbi:MAG: M48 family metallopeptidase [Bacteroidales bacterium]|nr:M48 family metallopeptidase [Bacteroidales bacterium]